MNSAAAPLRLRVTALVAAVCVLVLSLFAASADWHAKLHGTSPADTHATVPAGEAGHVCAVTLLADGVTALLVFCLLLLGAPVVRGEFLRLLALRPVEYPRYRLVPAHAPPAA